MIPYSLPHLLKEDDFEAERSLSNWIELWFGGHTEREVDDLYMEVEMAVKTALNLEFSRSLCEVEDKLTSEQRLTVWRTLIGMAA